MTLGHIPNYLPLGLKSIEVVSNIHLQLMIIELLDFEGFSKWVGEIFFSIDLLKIDVTSIHELTDKVMATQNVFDFLIKLKFLDLSYGTSAIIV